jgi:mannose-6-phosphate isomerase-like protein (cupin superfamily)
MDTISISPTGEKREPGIATSPVKFSMKGLPLLSSGATVNPLGTTENLWLSVKVYSRGGENMMHAHGIEDHAFVVLQGKATFKFGDGSSCEVTPYEGILIPKKVLYNFQAGEEENLVLLRIGAAQRSEGWSGKLRNGTPIEMREASINVDGTLKNPQEAKTGTPAEPIVRIPGKFFPEKE